MHYKAKPTACHCGNHGVFRKGSDWVCERCNAMERDAQLKRNIVGQNRIDSLRRGKSKDWVPDEGPICGGSLRILERMLRHLAVRSISHKKLKTT